MKLWILAPNKQRLTDPWEPWYDKSFGFVVRAETEQKAREIVANDTCGDEGSATWLDPSLSNCDELTVDGTEEVIICDFQAA